MGSKKFVIMALDIDNEIFVIYMAIRKWKKMSVHFKRQAHIEALLFDEAFIEVLAEYSDYSNVFWMKNITELLENIRMNEYAIKLEENK